MCHRSQIQYDFWWHCAFFLAFGLLSIFHRLSFVCILRWIAITLKKNYNEVIPFKSNSQWLYVRQSEKRRKFKTDANLTVHHDRVPRADDHQFNVIRFIIIAFFLVHWALFCGHVSYLSFPVCCFFLIKYILLFAHIYDVFGIYFT